MEIRVLADAATVAVEAAKVIAEVGRGAVAARGRFSLAGSVIGALIILGLPLFIALFIRKRMKDDEKKDKSK